MVGSEITLTDPEMERAVLGSMLRSPAMIGQVLEAVAAVDFADSAHRAIFRNLSEMVKGGERISGITLSKRLKAGGLLQRVGGREYIDLLEQRTPPPEDCPQYCKIVKDRSVRRTILAAINDISNKLYRVGDIDDMISESESAIFSVRQGFRGYRSKSVTGVELGEGMLEHLAGDGDPKSRVPVPWPTLQENTKGLPKGCVFALGGYPKDGKSAGVVQFLETAAGAGHRVGFWSLEMWRNEVMMRMLSASGVPYDSLISPGELTDSERSAAMARAEEVKGIGECFDVITGSAKVENIVATQMREAYDVIVLDHLHHMSQDRGEIESIMRALKDLATDTGCLILVLCQLSRRPGKPKPTADQLRESAAIEFMTDGAFFLWLCRDDDGNKIPGEAVFIVDLMRNGKSGYEVPLIFDGGSMRFREPEYHSVAHEVEVGS